MSKHNIEDSLRYLILNVDVLSDDSVTVQYLYKLPLYMRNYSISD